MSYVLIGVLVLVGLAAMVLSPWIGAAVLFAALVVGGIALVGSAASGAEGRDEPVDTALPGPGDPAGRVD